MAYDSTAARREMLDDIAAAAEEIAAALAALSEAYEQLDEAGGERLEEELFGPVQAAYGLIRRTHAGFAKRAGLPGRTFASATPGHPSQGVAGFVQAALDDVENADTALAELQDSMRPVEVGDAELRDGLARVRRLLDPVPARGRDLLRRLGR